MGNQVDQSYIHWNYFIALEQDLSNLARFIEFSTENFETYSIELVRLLLAAASEVDVVLKLLCGLKDPNGKHKNIDNYKRSIKAHLPQLIGHKCYINRYGLTLEPWEQWKESNNPIWWRSYNDVKHERNLHFKDANLKNTLNAMAGLSLVVVYYYQEIFNQVNAHTFRGVVERLNPKPSLFDIL